MATARHQSKERIYVKVNSSFDETGYMRPVSVIWKNRILKIESIRDFRPAASKIGYDLPGDCYTVVIGGEERNLFFQKTDPLFPSKVGRWFVEGTVSQENYDDGLLSPS